MHQGVPSKGGRPKLIENGRIHLGIVAIAVSARRQHQSIRLHHTSPQRNRQPLVVGDVLNLGADNATSFLEQTFIAPIYWKVILLVWGIIIESSLLAKIRHNLHGLTFFRPRARRLCSLK